MTKKKSQKKFFTSKLQPTIFQIFFNYLFTHNITVVRMFVFVSLRVTRANDRVTHPMLKNPYTHTYERRLKKKI